jgi:hypothetical protein
MSKLDLVIVGNIVIYPALAKFLKKSCYYMKYDQEKETIRFFANDGDGGETLMEIRNASHENALKIAKILDLTSQNKYPDQACFWSKYHEVLHLVLDGSEEAEWLRVEIFKLGIACRVSMFRSLKGWELHKGQYCYGPPMWIAAKVLEEIKRYNQEQPTLDIN